MTEGAKKPAGRWLAVHFLVQQLLVPYGLLLATYYIFVQIRDLLGERFGEGPEVEAWRWITILSLIILGFGAAYFVQRAWRKAYFAGRFIWILPTLFFIWMLVTTIPKFTLSDAIMYLQPAHFAFELMVGAIAYSLGITVAHRKHH